MAYRLCYSIPTSGETGLTLSAQLTDPAGANVGSAITTGFVEFGLGLYGWDSGVNIPDSHRGFVKISATAPPGSVGLKVIASINPEEAEYTDAKVTSTRPHAD